MSESSHNYEFSASKCHLKIIEAKKKGAVSTPKKTQRSSVRRHSRKR